MKPDEHTPAREPASSPLLPILWLLLAVGVPAALVWFAAGEPEKTGQSGAATLQGDRPGSARPEQALEEHRARMAEWLESYGWIDREAGIARMPIEEGMKAVLRAGLPAREEIEEQR